MKKENFYEVDQIYLKDHDTEAVDLISSILDEIGIEGY